MLGTVLLTLAVLLLLLLVGAALVLLSPMRVEARAVFPAEKVLHTRIRFLWGVTPWVQLPAMSMPQRRKAPQAKKSSGFKIDGERMKSLFSDAPKIFRSLFKAFKFETGRLDLEYGLGDPADTGMLYGYMSPVSYVSPASGAFQFSAQPNFGDQVFHIEGVVNIVFKPAYLLGPIATIGWRLFKP